MWFACCVGGVTPRELWSSDRTFREKGAAAPQTTTTGDLANSDAESEYDMFGMRKSTQRAILHGVSLTPNLVHQTPEPSGSHADAAAVDPKDDEKKRDTSKSRHRSRRDRSDTRRRRSRSPQDGGFSVNYSPTFSRDASRSLHSSHRDRSKAKANATHSVASDSEHSRRSSARPRRKKRRKSKRKSRSSRVSRTSSHYRANSQSLSRSRFSSRSKSHRHPRSKSRPSYSRSRSRSKTHSRSVSRTRSRRPSKSNAHSPSVSPSRSRSRSRSPMTRSSSSVSVVSDASSATTVRPEVTYTLSPSPSPVREIPRKRGYSLSPPRGSHSVSPEPDQKASKLQKPSSPMQSQSVHTKTPAKPTASPHSLSNGTSSPVSPIFRVPKAQKSRKRARSDSRESRATKKPPKTDMNGTSRLLSPPESSSPGNSMSPLRKKLKSSQVPRANGSGVLVVNRVSEDDSKMQDEHTSSRDNGLPKVSLNFARQVSFESRDSSAPRRKISVSSSLPRASLAKSSQSSSKRTSSHSSSRAAPAGSASRNNSARENRGSRRRLPSWRAPPAPSHRATRKQRPPSRSLTHFRATSRAPERMRQQRDASSDSSLSPSPSRSRSPPPFPPRVRTRNGGGNNNGNQSRDNSPDPDDTPSSYSCPPEFTREDLLSPRSRHRTTEDLRVFSRDFDPKNPTNRRSQMRGASSGTPRDMSNHAKKSTRKWRRRSPTDMRDEDDDEGERESENDADDESGEEEKARPRIKPFSIMRRPPTGMSVGILL